MSSLKTGDLCSSQKLYRRDNNLTEEFDSIVESLCGYAQMELQTLDLSWNALWGSSSAICLFSRFPLLRYLGPRSNKLDSTIS